MASVVGDGFDDDDALRRLEVRVTAVSLISHPHAMTLAGLWLGGTHIGQDDVSVEAALLVDVLGGGVEAGSTPQDTLLLALLCRRRDELRLPCLSDFPSGSSGWLELDFVPTRPPPPGREDLPNISHEK